MKISHFKYTEYLAQGMERCGIQSCIEPHHVVLAIACYLPVPLVVSKKKPLTEQQALRELTSGDDGQGGRISVTAGDVEKAVWQQWPDAIGAGVGNGCVRFFLKGSGFVGWPELEEVFRDFLFPKEKT